MEWLSELGPAAGAVAVVVVFLKFISDQSKTQAKRDEMFAKSLEANTKAMKEVAAATKKSANEAEQRNGHLGDQNVQIMELAIKNQKSNQDYQKSILEMIKLVNNKVENQNVENQVIEHQEVK